MERLVVEPSVVKGELEAQPSKSYTHRLLSMALLADGCSFVRNPLISLDTQATVEAVRILGGGVESHEDGWNVNGTSGRLNPKKTEINVHNSGTTLRFMSAISSLSRRRIKLTGDRSILRRPMGPLIKSLSDIGTKAECKGKNNRPPVVVGGGLDGGETRITGSISSQFISALLIASPYSANGVDIEVEGRLRSKPYVEITLKVLDLVGAKIKRNSSLMEYNISGGQIFDSVDFTVPGDFSSASFILGAGALSGEEVSVKNLDYEDVQGDKRILDLLKDFGAKVKVDKDRISVSGGELEGIDVDCSDTPDLVPVLAVLGAFADGQTRLHNIPHLRFKEVDRIKALKTELEKLGVRVKELKDGLKIIGADKVKGGAVDSYGDHRMAMAMAICGLSAKGKMKIKNSQSIRVSYPNFVEDMKKIGASIKAM